MMSFINASRPTYPDTKVSRYCLRSIIMTSTQVKASASQTLVRNTLQLRQSLQMNHEMYVDTPNLF